MEAVGCRFRKVVSTRLPEVAWKSKDIEKVFVAPQNDRDGLDGLELSEYLYFEHSRLIEFTRPTILLGPSSVQILPRLVLWMILTKLVCFGPTRLAGWGGPRAHC